MNGLIDRPKVVAALRDAGYNTREVTNILGHLMIGDRGIADPVTVASAMMVAGLLQMFQLLNTQVGLCNKLLTKKDRPLDEILAIMDAQQKYLDRYNSVIGQLQTIAERDAQRGVDRALPAGVVPPRGWMGPSQNLQVNITGAGKTDVNREELHTGPGGGTAKPSGE